MARGCEVSPQMRARICELRSIQWSYNRIHQKYPEIPLSTIKGVVRRASSQANFTSKPRSGRRRALTDEQRDHVYDIVNHTNPHIKLRDLLREVDDVVKKRSLQGLLREMNKRK
jgi:transposase